MSGRQTIRLAYRLLGLVNTLTVLLSGDPRRIQRRARNIAKGRLLAKSGFWRF